MLKCQSVYEFIVEVVSLNETKSCLLNGEAFLDLICKIILKPNNRLLSIFFSSAVRKWDRYRRRYFGHRQLTKSPKVIFRHSSGHTVFY